MKKLFTKPTKRTPKAPVVVEDWPLDETRPVVVEAEPAPTAPDVVGAHEMPRCFIVRVRLANSSRPSLGGALGHSLIAAAQKWLSEHELGDE